MSWPADDLEELSGCPVCGGASAQPLYDGLADAVMACAPGLWRLHRCRSCGAGYLSPRPTAASIHRAYATYYTHRTPGESSGPPEHRGSIGRALQSLVNGYINGRYGYSLSPAARAPGLLLYLIPARRFRADQSVRRLRLPRAGARLLDVGCGNGEFLLKMRALGWEAAGQDFDEGAVEAARAAGLDVRLGQLADCKFEAESFDAVSLNHVIEHLFDPVQTLSMCRRLLKPGGCLTMTTPNLNSATHRLFRRHWRGLEVPRHLVIFTPRSLRIACERAGMRVEREGGIPEAVSHFRRSAAIARGLTGDQAAALSPAQRRQARWLDLISSCAPSRAEEITIVARRV